jgi:hypothetical protein
MTKDLPEHCRKEEVLLPVYQFVAVPDKKEIITNASCVSE